MQLISIQFPLTSDLEMILQLAVKVKVYDETTVSYQISCTSLAAKAAHYDKKR